MKMFSLPTALALVGMAASAVSLQAIPVNYQFVLNPGFVIAGGGTFTATTTFDSTLFGTTAFGFPAGGANPLAVSTFTATLAGNATPNFNHTWDRSELSATTYTLTAGGALTFSAIQASDTANLNSNFLNGGSTGFSAPVQILGSWQQVTASVPDSGPGLVALLGFAALGFFAHKARKNRPAA